MHPFVVKTLSNEILMSHNEKMAERGDQICRSIRAFRKYVTLTPIKCLVMHGVRKMIFLLAFQS